jgi:hypothetical protein
MTEYHKISRTEIFLYLELIKSLSNGGKKLYFIADEKYRQPQTRMFYYIYEKLPYNMFVLLS